MTTPPKKGEMEGGGKGGKGEKVEKEYPRHRECADALLHIISTVVCAVHRGCLYIAVRLGIDPAATDVERFPLVFRTASTRLAERTSNRSRTLLR